MQKIEVSESIIANLKSAIEFQQYNEIFHYYENAHTPVCIRFLLWIHRLFLLELIRNLSEILLHLLVSFIQIFKDTSMDTQFYRKRYFLVLYRNNFMKKFLHPCILKAPASIVDASHGVYFYLARVSVIPVHLEKKPT